MEPESQKALQSLATRKESSQKAAKSAHKRKGALDANAGPSERERWDNEPVTEARLLAWIADPSGTSDRRLEPARATPCIRAIMRSRFIRDADA